METFSALLAICAGIHRSPVNSPHESQWRGALMFSLICAWIHGWVNNHEAGNLRRYRVHYDVIVMKSRDITTTNVLFFSRAYCFRWNARCWHGISLRIDTWENRQPMVLLPGTRVEWHLCSAVVRLKILHGFLPLLLAAICRVVDVIW